MALAYITRAEAKDHCRVVSTLDDAYIDTLIESCSIMVKNFLGNFSAYEGERNADDDYVLDSNYEPEIKLDSNNARVVKAEVKLVVKLLVARYYNGSRMAGQDDFGKGRLPPDIEAILWPLRDPVCR